MNFKPLFFNIFFKYPHRFYVVPTISLYYNSNEFLETGVYSKAFGFTISWLFWAWEVIVQNDI